MDDVINSRIRMAKEYLVHGSHSVNEVAALCGYNKSEHFCRQFKQITGYTPSAFRIKNVHTSIALMSSGEEY